MSTKNSTAKDTGSNTPPEPKSDDPFDPANLSKLRMSQDFASMAQVKPAITTLAVRKPHKHEFVRVRVGSEWRFETGCFVDKENREVYLVSPPLWPAMPGDVTRVSSNSEGSTEDRTGNNDVIVQGRTANVRRTGDR
jgi:hypothetical protein